MASKSKGKSLLFEAFANSPEKNHDQVNIFEYEVVSESQKLIPSEKISVFRNFFSLSPRFTIIAINITFILFLIIVGYWVSLGISGAIPKQYGDFCNLTSDCSQQDYYVCSENTCKCPTGMFYKTTCVKQLGYLSSCSFDIKDECGYGLYCSLDQSGLTRCLCSTERYWDTVTDYCELRIAYDQTGCSDTSQCQINSNLVCQASKCTCVYPNYWNGTYCNLKSSYLETCSIELGCDETKLLNCTINGDYVYRCDCDYTRFWSTVQNTCTLKYLDGISCNISEECRTDLGLQCNSTMKQCQCDSNFYWDGSLCLIKKNNTETCSATVPCNENQGLECNAGTCSCPTNYFHNGVRCQYYINTGLFCDASFICDSTLGLICDLTLNQCICPTTHFWNYTICVTKFLNGSSCINNIQCDETRLLSCDLTNNQCLCSSVQYWNSLTCVNKLTIGTSCSQTYECQDYLGLICSTTCQCPTDYYWDGSKCSPQLSFFEICTNSGHEPCLQSKDLFCSSSYSPSRCRCTDIQKYWNSTNCVPKLLHSENCIYQRITNDNNQCADYPNYSLICLATPYVANSWSCQCPTNTYYDSGTGSCLARKTFRESCTVSTECEDYYGLICYSNSTCLCPSTQYWNGRCTEKLAYGSNCTATLDGANEPCQDYAFIYCISSVCGCVSTRYYDTTYSACLPRSSHNQRCDYTGQCMASSPYSLQCISNTCQCEYYNSAPNTGNEVYWSVSLGNCVLCPTGYSTRWGSGVYSSPNKISNRCYKIVKSNTNDYASAQADCQANSANLITIRNIMELNMIYTQFSPGSFDFLVGATGGSNVFTWSFNSPKPVQNTFYCNGQPNNWGGNQNTLVLQNGKCFNDLGNSASYSYICEKG